MAVEYTWTVYQCEHEIVTGGITAAHWRVVAVDNNYSTSSYGVTNFNPITNSTNFKPYNKVTENEVLKWVWATDPDLKEKVETLLFQQIDAQKNPVTAVGTPWKN